MISVAMTTYNGEKFLREQIDSILNQTHKDIELVICDDGSTDSTREILKEYEAKDKRVRIFFNETNLGFKKNFEKAASLCNGDYIAFSDQDDVWELTKIQDSIEHIGSNKLLCTDALEVDTNLTSLDYTLRESMGLKELPKDYIELQKNLIHHTFVQGATILATSEFIKSNLPFPDEIQFHDWYFGVLAAVNKSLVYLNKPTIKYRQHGKNITSNEKKTLKDSIKPVPYKREEVLKNAKETLCLIETVRKNTKDKEILEYLNDSKRYYEELPDKKFYTLKYASKYFEYMEWNHSFTTKFLTLFKKFWGIVLFPIIRKK